MSFAYNNSFDQIWINMLRGLLSPGARVLAPRGKQVRELDHVTIVVDLNRPVLLIPERKLNYRFAAAEALWIIQGRYDVFHPRMAPFSDDGETLAGAYGPQLRRQLPYILDKLTEDRDTRQATATIWTPNPAPSRDIPCTIAVDFKIRDNLLNMHVFMRSSDVWLGIPYDVFSFSCYAIGIASYLNTREMNVGLGRLYLTAASSHLYEMNVEDAKWAIAAHPDGETRYPQSPVPPEFYDGSNDGCLEDRLHAIANGEREDRWWLQID